MTKYLKVPGGTKIITSDPLETANKGKPPRSLTVQHNNPAMANMAYNVPVPIVTMFYEDPDRVCNKCKVRHDVKVVHLDLDENARAMVSWGVYKDLRMGGMPHLTVVGSVAKPPTLILRPMDRGISRRQVNHANRKQTIHTG